MATKGNLRAKGRKIGRQICIAEGLACGSLDAFARGLADGFMLGWAEGRAEAKGNAVLSVLAHREVSVSAMVRKRVLASRNETELERWFERSITVTSAKGLFATREPASRSRTKVVPATSGGGRGRLRLVAT